MKYEFWYYAFDCYYFISSKNHRRLILFLITENIGTLYLYLFLCVYLILILKEKIHVKIVYL